MIEHYCLMYFYYDRDVNPNHVEISFQLTIDADILSTPVPYKYLIFSPKTKGGKDMPYEFIHSVPSGQFCDRPDVNRALCILDKKWTQCIGGTFTQNFKRLHANYNIYTFYPISKHNNCTMHAWFCHFFIFTS